MKLCRISAIEWNVVSLSDGSVLWRGSLESCMRFFKTMNRRVAN